MNNRKNIRKIKMANKKSKFWLILVGIPLILIIGFVIFLKLYFTSEKLKALVIPKLETSINRSIEVADVSFSIFPSFGIDLKELVISNPDSINFKKKNFFRAERILFSVKLLPLLKNQIEIKQVLIKTPELYLEVNQQGNDNYSFGESSKDTAKSTTVKIEISKQASLLLNNFQISDAKVEYLNLLDGTHFVISGYNQTTKVQSLLNEDVIRILNEIDISSLSYGDTSSYLIQDLPLISTHALSYFINKDELNFDSCSIKVKQLIANCTGKISGLMGEMNFDLHFKSSGNELNSLLSLLPEKFLQQKEGFESKANYKIELDVIGVVTDTTIPAIKGNFNLDNGLIKYSKLPKSITDIILNGDFEKSPTNSFIDIKKFSFRIGSNTISGNVNVKNFDNPFVNLNLQGLLNLTEVKDYYPLEVGTKLYGSINGNIKISGEVQKPDKVKAQGKVTLKEVAVVTKENEIHNISGEIAFNNERINSNSLKIQLGKSDLETSFDLKNYMSLIDEKAKAKPILSMDLNSNLLRTEDIFKEQEQVKSEKSENKSTALILPDVDATIRVNVRQFEMEKFVLSNLKGEINVANILLNLKNLTFNIFDGSVNTEGKIDLKDINDKRFSLKLDIKDIQANSFLSKFTTFGSNIFGKLNLNTTLSGSVDDTLGLKPQLLSGFGNVKLFDGKLIGYPLMQKIAEYTGINELRELYFREWINSFTITDGKILFKDLRISALNSELISNGSQSFDGNVQMNLDLKLSSELSNKLKIGGTVGQIVNFFKDKDGRVVVPLIVSGYYKTPTISLNTKQQQKQIEAQIQQEIDKRKEEVKEKVTQEAEKLLDTVKQKGVEELKKKTEDALKKLFRKP